MGILHFLPYSWEHTTFGNENTISLLNSCSFLYAVFSIGSLEKGAWWGGEGEGLIKKLDTSMAVSSLKRSSAISMAYNPSGQQTFEQIEACEGCGICWDGHIRVHSI